MAEGGKFTLLLATRLIEGEGVLRLTFIDILEIEIEIQLC